jgi:homoserine O-acetyltransferase
LTVRDMVHAQYQFLQHHKQRVAAVIGGSLGGMQVWEWAVMYPHLAELYIPLAVTPALSAYAISYNHIAERAIEADLVRRIRQPDKQEEGGISGLEIARMIGMITYRSPEMFNKRFGRERRDAETFQVQSYLDYQGKKLKARFHEQSYLALLRAMNSHDITRGRGELSQVLESIQARIILGAFRHDLLYPPEEIERTARVLEKLGRSVSYFQVDTLFGHDGFLVEAEKWQKHVQRALRDTLLVNHVGAEGREGND